MKTSLIVLLTAAAANAAPASEVEHSKLEARTFCDPIAYDLCCGNGWSWWKRTLQERTVCFFCDCVQNNPQPDPPATTKPVVSPTSTKPVDQPTSTKPVDQPTSTKPVQQPTTTKPVDQPTTTKPVEQPTTTKAAEPSTITSSPPKGTESAAPGSCKALAPGANSQYTVDGVTYTVNCGKDIPGGDIAAKPVDKFGDCFALCSSTSGCVGFSYLSGTCYLKGSQNGPLVDSSADVAQRVSPPVVTPTQSSTSAPPQSTTSAAGSAPTGACSATGNGASFGNGYTASCETDYPGNDFANAPSQTFAGCADQCDKLAGCIGFSYTGGQGAGVCYFKNGKGNAVPNKGVDSGFRPTQSTTSAAGSAPTGACSATGNGASFGNGYTASCETDYPGSDFANAPSQTFAGCADQCDKLAGCIGFSYTGGQGAGVCYFKNGKGNAVPNKGVDSGFRPTPVTPSASSASTTATAPADPKTTSTASTSVPTGSCQSTVRAGYTIACGEDHNGGDLSNSPANSFSDCFDKCDALKGCAGFAYVGGSGSGVCYFKSTITNGAPNSNVDFASKDGFKPDTSSKAPEPTTTTTAKNDPASTTTSKAPVPTTTTTTAKVEPTTTSKAPVPTTTTTTAKADPTTTSKAPVPTTTTTTAKPDPTTSSKAPAPTSTKPADPPAPVAPTYELTLYNDYNCFWYTGQLIVGKAQQGQCIGFGLSDSFTYKSAGTALGCRLVAYNTNRCTGRSVVLQPGDFSQQCFSLFDSVRYECS